MRRTSSIAALALVLAVILAGAAEVSAHYYDDDLLASWEMSEDHAAWASEGETVAVRAAENGYIPATILHCIQGRDATLYVDGGWYAWYIDGPQIKSLPWNLVYFNTAVAYTYEDAFLDTFGPQDVHLQLRFRYKGELPFPVRISLYDRYLPQDRPLYLAAYNWEAKTMTLVGDPAQLQYDGTVEYSLTSLPACTAYAVVTLNRDNTLPSSACSGDFVTASPAPPSFASEPEPSASTCEAPAVGLTAASSSSDTGLEVGNSGTSEEALPVQGSITSASGGGYPPPSDGFEPLWMAAVCGVCFVLVAGVLCITVLLLRNQWHYNELDKYI